MEGIDATRSMVRYGSWSRLAERLAGRRVQGIEMVTVLEGWQFMGADAEGNDVFRLRAGARDDYPAGPHKYEKVRP